MSPPLPEMDSFDARVKDCLEAAKGFASFTSFPSVGSAHLALALLSDSEGWLDPLLKELFSGLKSATVFESLVDILKTEADIKGCETASGEPQLSEDARGSLSRAEAVSEEWNLEQLTVEALAFALFEKPDQFVVEAFGDAGVKVSALEALAKRLAESGEKPAAKDSIAPAFQGGEINFEAFGRVTQDALRMLAKIAASEADRNLRDIDLIFCLAAQSDSLMIEALHVMGAQVRAIRSQLENMAGSPVVEAAASGLKEERMSRLLKGVVEKARELATSERCLLISESHLLRAHLDRVAAITNNIYQRLGINTAEMRNYLAGRTEDRAKAESREQQGQGKIEDPEGYLFSHVIGQEQAVQAVLPPLRRMRAGLTRRGRVLGKFMFLGPTGVGKTELALAIADVAFGVNPKKRDACLIRLDCGNFIDERDVVQLLGAPQGLVGYKEGQLTNGLRDKPRSVILFDEAEKAHPHIWQSLLPLFDTGIVREADGTEYDATGCILVATSNLGYKEAMSTFNLWEATEERRKAVRSQVEEFVWQRVQNYFSPEFRARFGKENILFFNHFDLAGYREIVRLHANKMIREFGEDQGLEITVKDEVIDFLAALAWQLREEGARTVGRLIDSHIADQIANVRLEDAGRTQFSFHFLEGSGRVALES